ncbi:acetate--CoA ligase family protein [Puniceibacterium sediminis]|uniref:Acyl-CoA synthetase (NDP forming) n=1 Tax=Puniceibacterium sediminis TaxID=1608407 RepID=A0A238UZT0_9RHOB|nr:acetate--CoA ligase family protein [Puniceibacterium sediminis]SNR27284.1 Acyl-CoA synthetase (NDP forming) [Puniceibacterium sediminis]
MTHNLNRLLKPRSVAVVGGGDWCTAVIEGLRQMGYAGDVWPVHPSAESVAGTRAYSRVDDLPAPPDACFVGVNRNATIAVVGGLAVMGAGGAVCFASGFSEMADGADLNAQLLAAAGDMPIIGPNCYGFINALDRAALWPDIHGLPHVTRGVAILTQSSNIALNLTMQKRGLPIAYMATAGNQAQTSLAQIGEALLADERVTALGLHVEGFGDIEAFQALALRARSLGKSVVVLKTGRSEAAQAAAVSHTASLAGSDVGASALIARLGMARVGSLEALIETLKLLHFTGPLSANQIACMSCSGGEASLVADGAAARGLEFAPLSGQQTERLGVVLGPRVHLSNPLDYNTFIWGNVPQMAQVFGEMMRGSAGLSLLVADFPREDRCPAPSWEKLIEAAEQACTQVGRPLAVVSSIADTMSEKRAQDLIDRGLIPLCGLDAALEAVRAAIALGSVWERPAPLFLPRTTTTVRMLDEVAAKAALSAHGVTVPASQAVSDAAAAGQVAEGMGRVALKARGVAHKSDQGGVVLGLQGAQAVSEAASGMAATEYLVEEMIDAGVELLIGVVADPAHGYVLTIGAGGVLTELWRDTVSLLLPVTDGDIRTALAGLRIAPRLNGYRGAPAVDMNAVVASVLAVQAYVVAQDGLVAEVEVNPLIALPDRAVAVDALIRIGERT